jgi:NitT/TauT family transport system substrate-binding protein
MTQLTRLKLVAAGAALLVGVTACSSSSDSPTTGAGSAPAGSAGGGSAAATLRLGYFANVTHAAAVLGVADGTYQKELGDTKLEPSIFNAGPAAIEALNAGAIDASFIGPSPAINAYAKSNGEALRVVAGATDNGASLVVKPDITSVADLKGKTIATPQLGGTQDVALRYYLLQNGLKVQTTGGDDVDVVNQENAQTLDLFKTGEVDGGWLPEPWASRLVVEAGATVLVDETTQWPGGKFPTTVLIVSKTYLEAHPDQVKALITGELAVLDEIAKDPKTASTELNDAIGELTGKKLGDGVIERAFANIKPTYDPEASVWAAQSEHAVQAGLLKTAPDLNGIFDLRILNSVLTAESKTTVSAAGAGQD